LSGEPFFKSQADIDGMTWHDARQYYLDPLLERLSKDSEQAKQGDVPTDPQGQHENMLALSMLLAKGKVTPDQASKAFFESYGKDFDRSGGEALVARMRAQQAKQQQQQQQRRTTKKPGQTGFKPNPKPKPNNQGGVS
jgi:hypothetical protein